MAEPVTTQQQGVSISRAAEAESEVAEVGGDRREEARSAAGAPQESSTAAAAGGVDEAGEEVDAAPRRYAVLTTGTVINLKSELIQSLIFSVGSQLCGGFRESTQNVE